MTQQTEINGAIDRYRSRLAEYTNQLKSLRGQANLISNLRLAVVLLAIAATVWTFRMHAIGACGLSAIAASALFIILVVRHARLFKTINELRILSVINQQGIDRCENKWHGFARNGAQFIDAKHPYSSDLDIFGKHSVYQYLCCAHSFLGEQRLAKLLQGQCGCGKEIKARQEATSELAQLIDWRQKLECLADAAGVGNDPHKVLSWAENTESFFSARWVATAAFWLPPITGGIAVAGYFLTKSSILGALFLVAQVTLFAFFNRRVRRLFEIFEKYNKALESYRDMVAHIEGVAFNAAPLMELRAKFIGNTTAIAASVALKRLAAAVAASEVRFSPIPWLLANVGLLWDLRCAVKLDTWKKMHGNYIRQWLDGIAEFEALSSLSILTCDHENWVFPVIHENSELGIALSAAGHPLIPPLQRVSNDFKVGPPGGSVAIITGSNMSGKSTMLRIVGCNLVLAYAGAAVCAQKFECPLAGVYTSMRSGDDLASNTSTFYAELLRVKMIVDAVSREKPTIFLLDELFAGTNSADRHEGALALLKELSKSNTLGLISTHDLELSKLEESNPLFKNFHFEEQYEGGELKFDYCIKNGPSTTRNALYLMRMAGIGRKQNGG